MSRDEPRSDPESVRGMRLRGDLPVAARLSRKVIVALAGGLALTIAAVTAWSLKSPPKSPALPPVSAYPILAPPPQAVTALPKDYAAAGAAAPPRPADVQWPALAATSADPASPAGGAVESPREPQEEVTEAKQARRSRLFEQDAASAAQPSSGGGGAVPSPAAAVAPDGMKAASALRIADKDAPDAAHVLEAGAVIPAALMTGIRSDLPGQVIAQVTQDVFDSATGRWRLIPQGARLVGTYESAGAFGQTRVRIAFRRLILPDGRSADLGEAPAADAQGRTGLQDGVDHRWGQIAGAALVSTLLGAGSDMGATSGESPLLQALRLGAASAANQAGQAFVGKTVGAAPVLSVRPGYELRVLVTSDLRLPAWGGA